MKKILYFIFIIIVILVIAVVIIFAGRPKEAAVNIPTNGLEVKDAQAQSYVVNGGRPEVKDEDKIFGDKKALLKIFVYENYSDEYSAVLADTLDKIRVESEGRVVVIVRPYVANSSTLARQAALAVDCASDQERWIEMRALLFTQAKNQVLNADRFNDYARQIGLDENKFADCLTKVEKSEKIEQSVREAVAVGILGAPTILIGDEMILGARPYEDFTDSNGDKIEGLKTVVTKKLGEIGK